MMPHAQTVTRWQRCLGYARFHMCFKSAWALFVLLGLCAAPCGAASSASSAVSDSLATSVGSVSDSVKNSSDSSSQNKRVAEGNYRIIEIIEIAQAPAGTVRLTLRAMAGDAEFFLLLPQQTVAQNQLARGHTVNVQHRIYGLQFSKAETGQAFFLALEDSSLRELQSVPLAL